MSNSIFCLIEQIAATPGKNDKVALIGSRDDDLWKKVLSFAYNPRIVFGMKAVPEPQGGSGSGEFNQGTWDMLEQMSLRQLTGHAARDAVQAEMNRLSFGSAELLTRIIKKDLRAGFSDSSSNKAFKGLIPEYPYMRCSLPTDVKFNEINWAAGIFSEEKADGMFANVEVYSDLTVSIRSRQGSEFPMEHFAQFASEAALSLRPETQTHGEFLVMKDGEILSRQLGNGIMNSVLKGGSFAPGEVPVFRAWDQIPLSAAVPKGRYTVPYKTRFGDLVADLEKHSLVTIAPIDYKIVYSKAEAIEHYRSFLLRGMEGTVIKLPEAIWRDGDSKEQIKLKLEVDVDLEIIRFLPGSGKWASTFGSILVATSCGQLEVGVSGMKDDVRKKLHAEREALPGKIMTIKGNSVMYPTAKKSTHSIFLPRYVEIRLDKTEADSLERVIAQFEAAVNAL